MCVHIHTYIHLYIHVCICKHTHTHTHALLANSLPTKPHQSCHFGPEAISSLADEEKKALWCKGKLCMFAHEIKKKNVKSSSSTV